MIASNGRLLASLFVALESQFLQALDLHASAAVNSIQARIAGLLKSISARGASQCPSTKIYLLQDELATMLGTGRQVVNRALRAMETAGAMHLQYGEYRLSTATSWITWGWKPPELPRDTLTFVQRSSVSSR